MITSKKFSTKLPESEKFFTKFSYSDLKVKMKIFRETWKWDNISGTLQKRIKQILTSTKTKTKERHQHQLKENKKTTF